ncbi:Flp family type IVb pilin [Thalassotalea crassostreae]|uniref:Flp family type IVb pilin n=1 Tax=Thalassotalea crassostreae TaxID=1763536 RepID=UPI0008391BE8|nr:pilus assembly protein [Thalassotalea crassostreae]
MSLIKDKLKELLEDESGLTAVEYAIAGGLVVAGMAGTFVALGDRAEDKITCLDRAVRNNAC